MEKVTLCTREMFKVKDRIAEYSEIIAKSDNWENIKRMRDEYIQLVLDMHPDCDLVSLRDELVRTANMTLNLYASYTEAEYEASR